MGQPVVADVFALGVGLPVDRPGRFPAAPATVAVGAIHAADVVRRGGTERLAQEDIVSLLRGTLRQRAPTLRRHGEAPPEWPRPSERPFPESPKPRASTPQPRPPTPAGRNAAWRTGARRHACDAETRGQQSLSFMAVRTAYR